MEVTKLPDDFTEQEKLDLQEYVKSGCPGLVKVDEVNVTQWFELYMAGKSYSEISKITNSKKDLILYMANRLRWEKIKLDHYGDLAINITKKVQQSKLDSANTVSIQLAALNKYFGEKFTKYISTNDKAIIDKLDTKLLAQYYKAIDTLDKILENSVKRPSSGKNETNVNVNINGNAKVEQIDDQTIEINQDTDANKLLETLVKYKNSKK